MKTRFLLVITGFIGFSCVTKDVDPGDPDAVRAQLNSAIDSLEALFQQDPKNVDLLTQFADACLSKSQFEWELSYVGWETSARPDLVEEPLIRAARELERAIRADTGSVALLRTLGRLYSQRWRIRREDSYWRGDTYRLSAKEALTRALALDSADVGTLIAISDLYTRVLWGRTDSTELAQGEQYALRAVELDPQNGHAYYTLGRIYWARGIRLQVQFSSSDRYRDLATRSYRKAVDLGVEDASTNFALARFFRYAYASSPEEFRQFKRTFEVVPGFIKGFFLAGLAFFEMSGEEKASRLLSKSLVENPLFPRALILRCDLLTRNGRQEEAIRDFLLATRLNPLASSWNSSLEPFLRDVLSVDSNAYVAHLRLAERYLYRGGGDAIGLIEKALRIKPEVAEAWLLLGRTYQKKGLPDQADSAYQMALSLSKDNTFNYWHPFGFYVGQGRLDKAEEVAYRELADGWSDSASVYWNLGNAFWAEGELQKARGYYSRGMGTAGTEFRRRLAATIAATYADERRYRDAISTLEGLLREPDLTDSEKAEFFAQLGEVYTAKGNVSRSIRSYEQAVALNPNIPTWRHTLGLQLLGSGRQDEGLKSLRAAADLGFGAAKDTLVYLESTFDKGSTSIDQ